MGIFDKIQDTTAAVTSSDKNTTSVGENCTIDGDITFGWMLDNKDSLYFETGPADY